MASNSPKSYQRRRYSVLIEAPIDVVWSELVKTDVALPFFFGSVCERPSSAPGQPFAMRSKNGKWTNVVGEVIEFSPPYRYSHTLKFTTYDDAPCKITYELKETPQGVQFDLTTEVAVEGTKTDKSMRQGGKFIVDNFKALIETGKPTLSGRFVLTMIALSSPFSPSRCASANWPIGSQ